MGRAKRSEPTATPKSGRYPTSKQAIEQILEREQKKHGQQSVILVHISELEALDVSMDQLRWLALDVLRMQFSRDKRWEKVHWHQTATGMALAFTPAKWQA